MQHRWQSATRYYSAALYQDLLGDWVLATARGGLKNNLGALCIRPVKSESDGLKELHTLGCLREKHGYRLLFAD